MTIRELEHAVNTGVIATIAHYWYKWTGFSVTPSQMLIILVFLVIIPVFFFAMVGFLWKRGHAPANPAATGRFLTDSEVLRYFRIPTKWTFIRKWPLIGALTLPIIGESVLYLLYKDFTFSPLLLVALVSIPFVAGFLNLRYDEETRKKIVANGFFQVGSVGLFKRKLVGIRPADRTKGILIPGPTGSGKTASYLLENILNDAYGDSSLLVIDRKTDEHIADIVGHVWKMQGKKVINFDPYRWKMNINPLLGIKPDFEGQQTIDSLQQIMDSIFGSYFANVGDVKADTDHFIGREYRLLKCLLMAVLLLPKEHRNLITVFDIVKNTPEELTRFIALSQNKHVIDNFRFFADTNPQERTNAMQGLYRKMQFLDSPVLRKALVRNDFDFDIFFNEPCIFIVKAELHRPDMGIIASMLTRLIQQRHYSYPEECARKKTKVRQIQYYLDEFGHLNLPNMHTFATTIRSSKGGLVVCVQDKEDLREYMKKFKSGSTLALESSLRTMIVLPGCHYEMCAEISRWLGEVMHSGKSKQRRWLEVFSFRYQEREERVPLITADACHFMAEDMCLVISNKRPFFAKQTPYYKDRRYKKLINKPVDFYMPAKIDDIILGDIAVLMRERASDIQQYVGELSKEERKKEVQIPEESVSEQAENARRNAVLQDKQNEVENPMECL